MEMSNTLDERKDIKYLIEQLSEENKRYVIAVANALLFSQNNEEPNRICKPSIRRRT